MRPFLSRYPQFFAGSPEFRDLQQTQETELLDLWAARDSALDQLCVDTATWGLRYWEGTLGIPVDGGKDLEVRRSRIKAKLMGADVTTVALVKSVAELHTGLPTEVVEFPNLFWVTLMFSLNSGMPTDIEGLTETLKEIMPAHLGWGFLFSLEMRTTLRIGGAFGAIVRMGIPRAADSLTFHTTLHAGGAFGSGPAVPVPEDASPPAAATILRTGGVCTIISNQSLPREE